MNQVHLQKIADLIKSVDRFGNPAKAKIEVSDNEVWIGFWAKRGDTFREIDGYVLADSIEKASQRLFTLAHTKMCI